MPRLRTTVSIDMSPVPFDRGARRAGAGCRDDQMGADDEALQLAGCVDGSPDLRSPPIVVLDVSGSGGPLLSWPGWVWSCLFSSLSLVCHLIGGPPAPFRLSGSCAWLLPADGGEYSSGGGRRWFVLPEAQDDPARLLK
jgi:hypothetical protein